jgi:FKBP-type peptidyl-prolyl cis-trans isomerase FklB
MKLIAVTTFLCLWLAAGICAAGEVLDFQDDQVRLGYSIGYLVGGDFLSQKRELNQDLLLQGIADALAGNKPRLSKERMKNTLSEMEKALARRELEQVAKPASKPH